MNPAVRRVAIATLVLGTTELAFPQIVVATMLVDHLARTCGIRVGGLLGSETPSLKNDLPLDEWPLFLIGGGSKLAAGIGLLLQRSWARNLNLTLGGVAGVAVLVVPVAALGEVLSRHSVIFDSLLRRGILCLVGGVMYGGYCGLVWMSWWHNRQKRCPISAR